MKSGFTWTWRHTFGVILAVMVVVVLWWAMRPAAQAPPDPTPAPAASVDADTADQPITTDTNPWDVRFPVEVDDLVQAADVAADFIETAGTYGPDTNPQVWRSTILDFLPTYDTDTRFIEVEPDWESVRQEAVSVVTEVRSVDVYSVSTRGIVVSVTAFTDPGGRSTSAVTLVPVPGSWAVDGVAVDTAGESGIGE